MRPAPNGAGNWSAIILSVAHLFTRPSLEIFTDLVAGWVLTPGRRTITRIIRVIDPEGRRAHDAYHRFLRDGVWQVARLWQILAVAIVERLVADDAEICLDLDDTLHHKAGRRIEGAGIFRPQSPDIHRLTETRPRPTGRSKVKTPHPTTTTIKTVNCSRTHRSTTSPNARRGSALVARRRTSGPTCPRSWSAWR